LNIPLFLESSQKHFIVPSQGTIASGLGILSFNPEIPFDSSKFRLLVDLVFTTWLIGFMLLIAGIWISILQDGVSKDAK